MHPIERLRYVARASGAEQAALVRETAGALAGLGFDVAELVTACRRIVARHPTSGPLWWLCARVLTAEEPRSEAWAAVEEIADDCTGRVLSREIPEDATVLVIGWPEVIERALPARGDVEVLVVDAFGEGSGLVQHLLYAVVDAVDVPLVGLGAAAAEADLVLIEPSVAGPDGFIAPAGSRAAAAVAASLETPVWAAVGVGRLIPARMWDHVVRRLDGAGDPWDVDDEVVPAALVGTVVTPDGLLPTPEALARVTCPIAPELFREAG